MQGAAVSKPLTISLALLWLFLALLAGYALWAFEPQGLTKWLLYAAVLPPLYIVLEGAGELLGGVYARLPGIRQGHEFVERRTAGHSVSGMRIVWHLFTTLLLIGIVLGLTWLYRAHGDSP